MKHMTVLLTIALGCALGLLFMAAGCRKDGAVTDPVASNGAPETRQTPAKYPEVMSFEENRILATSPNDPTDNGGETGGDIQYRETFRHGPGGWVPVDLTEQTGVFWHRATYSNRGVMWCGTDDPSLATPPGYGHNWVQDLTKSFLLPDGNVTLHYVIQYETESSWDFVWVEVSADGGATYETLARLEGLSGGFVSESADLSAYAGSEVIIRFRFTSDPAYDDADGFFDSDGAVRLDQVEVTGFGIDDFETGNDGWLASAAPSVGGAFRLESQPACATGLTCDTDSWVAYEPETGVFPFIPESEWVYHRDSQIAIESPVINLRGNADRYVLEFDVYDDLPVNNIVYFTWQVASPPPEEGGKFKNSGFVYYDNNSTGFTTWSFDITGLVAEGASSMRIRLVALDLLGLYSDVIPFSGEHTAAPMFDNVKVRAVKPKTKTKGKPTS